MFNIIIILLVILAFILRILFIFQGSVSFHYDMARDAFMALQIWNGDLKILGPPTSTPGLYHGVLYYYLLAPLYGLSKGDPQVVAAVLSLLNSLAIVPLGLLAKDIFKHIRWVFLAAFLFVISFEATQYAGWISNPSPAILTLAWFFYFLRIWQKGKKWGLYGAIAMAALSTQFQFFLIYLFILILIFGFMFNKSKFTLSNLPQVLLPALVTILGLSSFLLSAVKFNSFNQIMGGFLNISTNTQIDYRPQFAEVFFSYINRVAELFTYNFSPVNVFIGGLFAIATIFAIRKNGFLLFYLFSNLPIFIFGGHTNTYANIGLVIPAILGITIVLKNVFTYTKLGFFFILLLIISSNLYAIAKYNPEGQIILVIPNDMNLKNELKLIDQTYKQAKGQPFSVSTLTLPLWTNTTWAYLYSWYGKEKYGYVPSFYGHDQVGLLGVDSLPKIDKPLPKTFYIIEPANGIPSSFYNQEVDTENSKTNMLKELSYGSIKLQVRDPKK